jgi:mono/diheme cytochrome c family protein
LALCGCGTSVPAPINPGSPPDPEGPVSFGFDIQPIFDKHCGYCHRANGVADRVGIRMYLASGESYTDIVNRTSKERPDLLLVDPGSAGASFLYLKVSRDLPGAGLRMPLFRPALANAETDLIRRWIADGAPQN